MIILDGGLEEQQYRAQQEVSDQMLRTTVNMDEAVCTGQIGIEA